MTPDEVIALLQVVARQQIQIGRLEAALDQAQQLHAASPTNRADEA
jgi:hypothetical protein